MIEINNQTKSRIDTALAKRTVENFLKHYRKTKYDVSIAFVGGQTMRKLNKQYRRKDRTTDVLAFSGEEDFMGEILINYQQIKKQAGDFGNSPREELVFIMVHGLLHLLGYNDDTPKGRQKMEEEGTRFIQESKKSKKQENN